jgi:peptide chain release factor 1
MLEKLSAIEDKYYLLEEQLSDPALVSDIARMQKINKEYKSLGEIITEFRAYKNILAGIEMAQEMIRDEDPEMQEMGKSELDGLQAQLAEKEDQLKFMLIPQDPEDSKDVLFEIRAGTGGDEAAIFAGDLFRMYTRFFDMSGWTYEILEMNEGTSGGYSKLIMEVSGEDVYGKMKFESGGHRVQRVPKTESQGRVHTSAATVAVIPKLEMEDVDIRKSDLKVDTFRASGAGGQHVNKTESGVRFTHLPTGLITESTEARSQIKNREIALQRLYQLIWEKNKNEVTDAMASQRKSQVGSGDRSEKVRTYNYPQNRVTDHRINLTLYNLDAIVEGNIGDIIEALRLHENTEKLKVMEGV